MTTTPSRGQIVARLRAAGCVFAEDEADLLLEAAAPEELLAMVGRRVAGEPLEVIVGRVDWAGLRIPIEAGVFVPRRRTEFLLDQAATLTSDGALVVDLCCGCGAIGYALKHRRPGIDLHAAELEPAAVANARRTLAGFGTVHPGDLYEALPDGLAGRVGVLVANAPYVPTEAVALMPPEAREHEPLVALDGGVDGLGVIRRVVAGAPQWLAPGGFLLFETDESQAPAALAAVRAAGLSASAETSEEYEATVLTAHAAA